MAYGADHSRYTENKRSVRDKDLGPDRQDQHDPLHPVHPLRALRDRNRGCPGTGRDFARREHGDHHLRPARAVLGTVWQSCRHLPCRGADLQALRLCRAALGAEEDRQHRRDGCGRLGHPRRYARTAGHADPAASQRGHQRGVAGRQVPPHRRRADAAAARQALAARRRQAETRHLGRGLHRHRRPDARSAGQPDRRARRRHGRCREHAGAQGSDGRARFGQCRLPAGRRGLRHLPPRLLHLQLDHRRHRGGRRAPADRHQPTA